jgi:thiol-disulfide isomerase/thioredoxin
MMSCARMSTRAHVAVAVLALLAGCASPSREVRSSPLAGRAVEIAAADLSGHEVRVTDGDGKVRVVDFWATWCDPCRDQLPFLGRLASAYGPDGLSVYGVSFDEDGAELRRFLERNPVPFAILWDKGGAALADKLEITRLPTTLVLDRRGVVREVRLGYDKGEESKIEATVRALLAERVAGP